MFFLVVRSGGLACQGNNRFCLFLLSADVLDIIQEARDYLY